MSLSTFLDGRPYTQLRGLNWLSLSETGYRMALAGSSDSGGGMTSTWGTAGTFACRVDPITGGEQLAADRIADRSTHTISMPPETTVSTADRIIVSGRGTYEITAVRDRTREWLRMVEAVQT